MINKLHHPILFQNHGDRIQHRFPTAFVNNPKHFADRPTRSCSITPTGQGLGHRIEQGHSTTIISGYHCITNTAQGNGEPLSLRRQKLLGQFTVCNIPITTPNS